MNKKFRRDYSVYCCPHVFQKERPILLVIRDQDGAWQFLCGGNEDTDDCHHVGVGHLLDSDPSIEVMANLSIASGAEREEISREWVYFELASD